MRQKKTITTKLETGTENSARVRAALQKMACALLLFVREPAHFYMVTNFSTIQFWRLAGDGGYHFFDNRRLI